MNNIENYDPSYSPSEPFEADERPDCSTCCDTGTHYDDEGREDFCDCASGLAASENALDHAMEDGLFEDDGDALASAGFGTDEDYGGYDYEY